MEKAANQMMDVNILAEAKVANLPIFTANINDFLVPAKGGGKLAERVGVNVIKTNMPGEVLERLDRAIQRRAFDRLIRRFAREID